jgi:hypothetical protein
MLLFLAYISAEARKWPLEVDGVGRFGLRLVQNSRSEPRDDRCRMYPAARAASVTLPVSAKRWAKASWRLIGQHRI